MVIDKSTGKGCAWSIASKTITQKLIAENILDKPIARKQRRNRYHLLYVVESGGEICVTSKRGDDLALEPLWTPSFIDMDIWNQAVGSFQRFTRLDRNVEAYLLPKMDEYLKNIPDTELVSMTRDFLIGHGVMNSPICQRKGNTYYFSENEVYSLDKTSELFLYEKRIKFNLFEVRFDTCFNMNVWRKAASQFEVGMTLKECIEIFLKTELVNSVPQEHPPIVRLVQSIASPIYERVPENKNKATFDYIHITVGLPRYHFNSWEALQDEVKKHQHEIYRQVIQKLEMDRQFKKYGVPANFLKVSDVILLRDFSLKFIFELKEMKKV